MDLSMIAKRGCIIAHKLGTELKANL